MSRDHILSEIQRTATANGGLPLGRRRFKKETGIDPYAWYGKYWTRWSDAVREAGFEPNELHKPHEPSLLIEKLVALTRSLGRLPVVADLMFARYLDSTFPSSNAFIRRLGSKSERARAVLAFCQKNAGYDDVVAIWRPVVNSEPNTVQGPALNTGYRDTPWLSSPPEAALPLHSPPGGAPQLPSNGGCSAAPLGPRSGERGGGEGGNAIGYVYLLKHGSGREYKIGRTHNPLRREGEVALELPDELKPIHYIKTDDPRGVESYWHARFKTKRKRGEWFALSADDVRAFRRWKRIH
jgi:hypothetical protein